MNRRAGVILILLSSLLAVLLVAATVFVRMSALQRMTSRPGVDRARAGLIARSGGERARIELGTGVAPMYGGEDYDADGALTGGTVEATAQRYRPGVLDVESCPAEHALRPSWFVPDRVNVDAAGNRAPALFSVDGVARGYSGRLRGTYDARPGAVCDTYTLRAQDLSGRIDLNLPNAPVVAGVGRMARLLNRLGQAIAAADGVPDPVAGTGAAIVAYRASLPGGRFSDDRQIVGTGPGRLSQAAFDRLRPYVTLGAWYDPATVTPVLDAGTGAFRGLAVQPRAPVNVNAASKPVLAALMTLSATGEKITEFAYTADFESLLPAFGFIGDERFRHPMTEWTTSLSLAGAGALADAMIARRASDPFDTWAEFQGWLATLPGGITARQGDLVAANGNPNTLLNKFNPAPAMERRHDKTDLREPTIEFSLAPTGTFGVETLGRVLDTTGRQSASAVVWADVAAWRLKRWTAQTDFEASGGTKARVVTLPEPMASPGAVATPWDGQVMLSRAEDLVDPGSQRVRLELRTGFRDAAGEDPQSAGVYGPPPVPGGPSLFNPAFNPADTEQGFFRNGQFHPDAGLFPWVHYREHLTGPWAVNRWEELRYDGPPNTEPTGSGSWECWIRPIWVFTEANDRNTEMFYGLHQRGVAPDDWYACMKQCLYFQHDARRLLFTVWYYNPGTTTQVIMPSTAIFPGWDVRRRWHHLYATWRPSGTDVEMNLCVDGVRVPGSPIFVPGAPFAGRAWYADPARLNDYTLRVLHGVYNGNPASLLDFAFNGSISRMVVTNSAARYPAGGFDPASVYELSDLSIEPPPPGTPAGLAGCVSPVLPLPLGSRLASLAWTSYQPSGCSVRVGLGQTGVGSGWMHEWEWDGSQWRWPVAVDAGGATVPLGRERIRVEADPAGNPGMGLVRWRAFLTHAPGVATVKESPILDDVTLAYVPPDGVRVTRWRDGS